MKTDRNKLALSEKHAVMLSALSNLDEQDREIIETMAQGLVKKIKTRNPMFKFSYENGVEVISCLGQFLAKGGSV